jgi:hypothetical protein
MAGCHVLRPRGGRLAIALALSFLTFADRARAQAPVRPLPTAATSAASYAEIAEADSPTAPTPIATTGLGPSYYPGYYPGAAPATVPVETGLFDTITESLFGKPDPNTWRPLPFSTLLSEGWNEAWVPSPSGSGGAPRQGWIDATDGNLYRLSFFTFAQAFNSGTVKGNAYLGAYTIFAPLSRRLDLIVNVPFATRNSGASGLPTINPTGQPTFRSQSSFGDISFTPRVLLHETKDFSLTSDLTVLVPTGSQPVEGKTQLIPNVGFWNNFAGRWVIRGGVADLIPLNGHSGKDTLISQLAIGQTLTDHDVRLFGDFTWYVSAVVNTPLSQGQHTSAFLTPGIRTHVGNDWYFLAGLPAPVTHQRLGDLAMIFWFMKAW